MATSINGTTKFEHTLVGVGVLAPLFLRELDTFSVATDPVIPKTDSKKKMMRKPTNREHIRNTDYVHKFLVSHHVK